MKAQEPKQSCQNFEDRVVASGSMYFDRVFGAIISGKQGTVREIGALCVILRLSRFLTSKSKSQKSTHSFFEICCLISSNEAEIWHVDSLAMPEYGTKVIFRSEGHATSQNTCFHLKGNLFFFDAL